MRLEENLAEKLARFRRLIRSRDVYDLAEMGYLVRGQLDLVRHILCFKVSLDIVRDGRESAVIRAAANRIPRVTARGGPRLR